MSEDISFLPDELREKEEKIKNTNTSPTSEDRLKMYIPQPEEEDIEVIEVDEGEVGEILGGEPLLARVVFKVQEAIDDLKSKLFNPRLVEPPPKLPPQFFTPPAATKAPRPATTPMGLVPIGGSSPTPVPPPSPLAPKQPPASAPVATAAVRATVPAVQTKSVPVSAAAPIPFKSVTDVKTKARIVPTANTPRRVRVIRRVRRPVRVSFLNEQSFVARVDIPRRRFTLIILAGIFIFLLGGSYFLLRVRGNRAQTDLAEAQRQLAEVQAQEHVGQDQWSSYRDLEPRLKSLSQLLDRHVSPSRIFDALEAHTVPTVYYSSFILSPDGQLMLLATAPSFGEAARQVFAFQRAGIATKVRALGYQARYNTATGQLEGVSFQMNLTLNQDVLRTSKPFSPSL